MNAPPHARPLIEGDLDPDPLRAFDDWFREAASAGLRLPEAAALATATAAGEPSARMVLVKGWNESGFVFYTGYESRKARELEGNPRAALLFYWDPLGRQVRIEGAVTQVSPEESAEYFATRPEGSRLSAWASRQSEPIGRRAELEARVEELRAKLVGGEIALPPAWGGYRLRPEEYEFWQHRDDRLHDRIRYRRLGADWAVDRLQP